MPIPCFADTDTVDLDVDGTGALIANVIVDPAGGVIATPTGIAVEVNPVGGLAVGAAGVEIRVPAVKVYLNPAGTTFHTSTGDDQVVFWDAESYDTDGMHSNTVNSDRLVATQDGLYRFEANVRFLLPSDAAFVAGEPGRQRFTSIRKNAGSARLFRSDNGYFVNSGVGADSSNVSSQISTGMIMLVAGDYIRVFGFQNSPTSPTGLAIIEGNPDTTVGASFASLTWVSLG